MADQKKKQLAFNIIEFLKKSCDDGTVKEDDKESLEVAISCIGESFGVDPESTSDQSQYSLQPATLLSLLDVYLKTKAKSTPSASASKSTPSSSTAASTSTPAPAKSSEPSEADKTKAESLKVEGNQQMSSKLYDSAIQSYTSAISLYANPVYYSNRAAAYSALGEHEKAGEDAQTSIDLNPSFGKGYSRLGHALFSQGKYQEAVDVYEKGLNVDPGNSIMKTSLGTAKAKLSEVKASQGGAGGVAEREAGAGPGAGAGAGAGAGGMPDLSALAGMFGGGGAGRGGGGGMPDLAGLMNNPQMMQMAQQMMANGGMERLMSNPNVRRMAEQFQGGGGMPDMGSLMNDPEMRNLAQNMMGGGAGRGQQ